MTINEFYQEKNIGGYIINPNPLAVVCKKCNTRLVPAMNLDVYSGGPFYCGKCKTNVTNQVYNKQQ
jgi:RNase P subunit RPR2